MGKTEVATPRKLSEVVKTDTSVNLDSVVAYFISKYENGLLEQKKILSDRIREINTTTFKTLSDEVEAEVKPASYSFVNKKLGLTVKASLLMDVTRLIHHKTVLINFESSCKTNEVSIHGQKKITISAELVQKFVDASKELSDLRTELEQTLVNLGNVSRKEREVRGQLAERTLRDAGVGELFDDEALLKIVTVPSLAMKDVTPSE
jgi:hypothetical protein